MAGRAAPGGPSGPSRRASSPRSCCSQRAAGRAVTPTSSSYGGCCRAPYRQVRRHLARAGRLSFGGRPRSGKRASGLIRTAPSWPQRLNRAVRGGARDGLGAVRERGLGGLDQDAPPVRLADGCRARRPSAAASPRSVPRPTGSKRRSTTASHRRRAVGPAPQGRAGHAPPPGDPALREATRPGIRLHPPRPLPGDAQRSAFVSADAVSRWSCVALERSRRARLRTPVEETSPPVRPAW
jgi:hypothetical protein